MKWGANAVKSKIKFKNLSNFLTLNHVNLFSF